MGDSVHLVGLLVLSFVFSYFFLYLRLFDYYYYYYYTPREFFLHQLELKLFLFEAKRQQVSSGLQEFSLFILADLSSAVVWMISIFFWFPFIESLFQVLKGSSQCPNYNWYHSHFIFHKILTSLSTSKYVFIFSLFKKIFTAWFVERQLHLKTNSFFFLVFKTGSGLLD